MRKVAGFFVGESPNDEEYTLEMKRKFYATFKMVIITFSASISEVIDPVANIE